jgi:hypothetical protein
MNEAVFFCQFSNSVNSDSDNVSGYNALALEPDMFDAERRGRHSQTEFGNEKREKFGTRNIFIHHSQRLFIILS